MDEMSLILSRIQFAMSAGYHFIFPPTTLGLAFFIFLSETFHLATKKEQFRKLSMFAVRILTLVFALGVATGMLLPFMFGMNWAEFAKHAGALFGVQLAVEATVAFTLESVFIGVLFFGKDKIKPFWYWLSALFVFFGSHLSGYIIIAANSWMQTPGGFSIDPATGRMLMTDFWAFNFNTSVGLRFAHVVAAAWMVGAFLLVACAAWFLKQEKEVELAKKLMTFAGIIALATAAAQPLIGHASTLQIEQTQPAKGAAMEGIYQTTQGAPLYAVGWVDEQNQKVIGIPLPGMLSFFYTFDFNSTVRGMNDPEVSKHGIPPVQWVFQNFRIMVMAGVASLAIVALVLLFHFRGTLNRKKKTLGWVVYAAVLPYLCVISGWFTAEIGRQPWVIYPVDQMGYPGLSTADALTKGLDQGYVWFSIIAYFLVYAVATIVFLRFLPVIVKKGIDPLPAHAGKDKE